MKKESGLAVIDILTSTLVVCGLIISGAVVFKPQNPNSIPIAAPDLVLTIGRELSGAGQQNLSNPVIAIEHPVSASDYPPEATGADADAVNEARLVLTTIESLAVGAPGGTLTAIPTTDEILAEAKEKKSKLLKFSEDASADGVDDISTTVVFYNGAYTVTSVSLDGDVTKAVQSPKVISENKNAGTLLFSSPVGNPAVFYQTGGTYTGPNGTLVLGF